MEPCSECLCFELQTQHLLPLHNDQRVFFTPQWNFIPQLGYVIYRATVACLICIWIAVDFFKEGAKFYSENMSYWFLFATNWGFLILALSAVLRALAALCHYIHFRRKENEVQPAGLAVMLLWVIDNIAANVALVVTLAYYTFLTTIDISAIGFMNTPMCILKHTLNSIYILCDLFFSAIPIRLLHMIYPMITGAIYVVFNAVYFTNGGLAPEGKNYTYHVMDWDKPGQAVSSSATGFFMTAFLQCLLHGVYRLRMFLYSKYTARKMRFQCTGDHEQAKNSTTTEHLLVEHSVTLVEVGPTLFEEEGMGVVAEDNVVVIQPSTSNTESLAEEKQNAITEKSIAIG